MASLSNDQSNLRIMREVVASGNVKLDKFASYSRFTFNPLSLSSDQHQISPRHISAL